MKIVLTGVGGLLGRDVWARLNAAHELWAVGRKRPPFVDAERWRTLDITRDKETHSILTRLNPDLVVHMAAMAGPDDCEKAPEEAFRVNALGTRNVAIACQRFDAALLHLSTNYVFGAAEPPEGGYREFDPAGPVNVYGLSKQWAEDFVRSLLNKFFIVRTAGLFGTGRRCFATEIVDACRTGGAVQATKDWTGPYTYAVDLAEALERLAESGLYGVYHIVNEGAGTRLDFARTVSAHLPAARGFRIMKKSAQEMKRPARRPARTPLNTLHWRLSGFKPLRPWEEAVPDFVEKMNAARMTP